MTAGTVTDSHAFSALACKRTGSCDNHSLSDMNLAGRRLLLESLYAVCPVSRLKISRISPNPSQGSGIGLDPAATVYQAIIPRSQSPSEKNHYEYDAGNGNRDGDPIEHQASRPLRLRQYPWPVLPHVVVPNLLVGFSVLDHLGDFLAHLSRDVTHVCGHLSAITARRKQRIFDTPDSLRLLHVRGAGRIRNQER